jgi:very-short-patch-repair endonuclease
VRVGRTVNVMKCRHAPCLRSREVRRFGSSSELAGAYYRRRASPADPDRGCYPGRTWAVFVARSRRGPGNCRLRTAPRSRHACKSRSDRSRTKRSTFGASTTSRQVRRRACRQSGLSQYSALRAIALTFPGLHLVPQLSITAPGRYARPDLVDEDIRLVIEADSQTWHSFREALRRDCRRYNSLGLNGWTVLRFHLGGRDAPAGTGEERP